MKNLGAILQQRKQDGLYRSRRISDSPQGVDAIIDGKPVINFCSNDYLGLANHPQIKQALIQGAEKYGTGSGSAHLVNGHSRAHHQLEEELAEFMGYPRALLFSTGYMANLGIAQALCGRGDKIFEDRLNHASMLDAALLSGARLQRYAHNDVDNLQSKLQTAGDTEKLIMSDGVFSMDGDLAPLAQLSDIAQQHDSWLMLDDAHGIGVLGKKGRGCIEHFNCSHKDVPIVMGTLGKAFGTSGAFVAGSEELIETLIQFSRSYIYTTASSPAMAEATRCSLKILHAASEEREYLQQLIRYFSSSATELGLHLMPSDSAIQPILIGDTNKAKNISQRLFEQGFLVTAIRPPTVPEGTARLRVTLSAAHKEQHIDKLLDALHPLCK